MFYYQDGEGTQESLSNRVYDIADLMARAHCLEDAGFVRAIIRVCRHALEPVHYDLRAAEIEKERQQFEASVKSF